MMLMMLIIMVNDVDDAISRSIMNGVDDDEYGMMNDEQ